MLYIFIVRATWCCKILLTSSISISSSILTASLVALVVKKPLAKVGDTRDVGSVPGLGRSPGGGHGNPLQYPCLENLMDRGAWWATVHRFAESWT